MPAASRQLSFARVVLPSLRQRWFQALLRLYFVVLRRVVLSTLASTVELVAEASGPSGAG